MNYAPEPAGNAPYTTALAEYLAFTGWDVAMETGLPHYPAWVRQQVPTSKVVRGVQITRHVHTVPQIPTAIRRALMEVSWTASSSLAVLKRRPTDIVLGISPSLSGAWLALAAAARHSVPCVLWLQDLMGPAAAQSGVKGGRRVAGLVRRAELAAIGMSDVCIVVADGYRTYLEDAGLDQGKIRLVRNWSLVPRSSNSYSDSRSHFGFDPDERVVVHSGNMGAKQGLDIVVDVAEETPEVTFVLQGNGSERSRLEESIRERGLTNVRFLPSLDSIALATLLAAADVLLLTQRPSVTNMSLPSKLTTYINAGRPIVASVNRESEAAVLLKDTGIGTIIDGGSPRALSQAVRSMAESRASQVQPHSSGVFGSPQQIASILANECADGRRARPV